MSRFFFWLFMFHVRFYFAILSVLCRLEITCSEKTLLCVVFSFVFVTLQYGVSGQV